MREPERSDGIRLVVESLWTSHEPVAQPGAAASEGDVQTDGPFAETREQLGGYYVVEAKSLDEATDIAGRIPGARVGSIEVRRIIEM